MKTAVVTDAKYRSAIPVTRALAKAGYRVVLTQTVPESGTVPPAFSSKYGSAVHSIAESAKSEEYKETLRGILAEYDRPVLFCTGADSLRAVAADPESFAPLADFLIPPLGVLDALNDKEQVHARAAELGIKVPKQYGGEPAEYPVVIKPHCGERFGLKAEERYAIAENPAEFRAAYEKMKQYDPCPIVQQKVEGEGKGACLLMGKNGELLNAYCHRRVREYPVSGGPSACCESFYEEELIQKAHQLLRSFGFYGMAMVEFKGDCLLEVNPRLWGSYPLSEQIGGGFTADYAKAAAGEKVLYRPAGYRSGVRMHFILNDTLSLLGYLKKGQVKKVLEGLRDLFFAKEALYAKEDPKPFYQYLKGTIFGK